MSNILMMHEVTPAQLSLIEKSAPGYRVVHATHFQEALPFLEETEIVCGWHPKLPEYFSKMPLLRWVQSWGAGVDGFPLDVFREKDILLANTSGLHANQISESVFAMMLAFTRGLDVHLSAQRDRYWVPQKDNKRIGEIHGKVLGIVGAGAIGTEVARLAKGFNMRVLGIRKSGRPAPYVDEMNGMDGLHRMLAASDIVVNILPGTPATYHVFNAAAFTSMKPDALYISVGRGATTDTEALMTALSSRQIAGAALDVFEQEPLPSNHPLWSMENVMMTPHASGLTVVYAERVMDIFLENLAGYLQDGKLVRNQVSLEEAY